MTGNLLSFVILSDCFCLMIDAGSLAGVCGTVEPEYLFFSCRDHGYCFVLRLS